MRPARRDVLIGGGLAIAAVAIGHRLGRAPDAPSLPAGLIPAGRESLVLHAGDGPARAFVRAVRASAPAARIGDRSVAVLARNGFARTAALLDRARGKAVIALLDDADAIVVESLLQARGAAGLTRRRHGGQMLLTAQI